MKKLEFFSETGWKEDPDFTHAQWQEAVSNGDTQQSYAGWVIAQHEIAAIAMDASDVEIDAAVALGFVHRGISSTEQGVEVFAPL